jgi:phosphoserine phosphatase RsbU/P
LINREDLLEKLERDLSLKELQIKSLLTITQAINDNVSQQGLFRMYTSFLSWEMGITHMLLFIKDDEGWRCVTSINYDETKADLLIPKLTHLKRLHTVKPRDNKELKDFDIVIPVYHKEQPIAYSLIGGIKEKEDLYNKIQFITTITNIIAVAIENKRLFKEHVENEKYAKDMELASEVQKMLIPDSVPNSSKYEVDLVYKPHSNIGGDYIDVIKFDEDKFALCIADISGKGIAAALLMANFQATLRSLIYQYRDMETFVYALNEAVYKITKSDKFITFFVAEIDIKKMTMRYINAGHYPPLLYTPSGIIELNKGTTVIGAFDKLPMIEETTIKLHKDDLLLCFTDGLADIKNDNEEYFDESVLKVFIEKWKSKSAKDFNDKLMQKLVVYKGDKEYVDDIAILTCKIK